MKWDVKQGVPDIGGILHSPWLGAGGKGIMQLKILFIAMAR